MYFITEQVLSLLGIFTEKEKRCFVATVYKDYLKYSQIIIVQDKLGQFIFYYREKISVFPL